MGLLMDEKSTGVCETWDTHEVFQEV
jgi:hypothetical protein